MPLAVARYCPKMKKSAVVGNEELWTGSNHPLLGIVRFASLTVTNTAIVPPASAGRDGDAGRAGFRVPHEVHRDVRDLNNVGARNPGYQYPLDD